MPIIPKTNIREEMIKIRFKINKVQNSREISVAESWFFEKTNKVDSSLVSPTKKKEY